MFVSFVIAIPASYLFTPKKDKKEVFFLGHKFDNNISKIVDKLQQSQEYDYQYCTLVLQDYLLNKKLHLNCLYLLSPKTWIRLLNSKIIISLHGIYFHKYFNFFSNAKTVYLSHAFRTGYLEKTNKLLYQFDEVWLSTYFEKQIYIKEAKYTKQNIHIVGYPKYDAINEYIKNSFPIKNQITNNHEIQKIITIGPTRNLRNKELKTNEFSIYNIDFLKNINALAKKLKVLFIISLHPTSEDISFTIKTFIESSSNIFTANDLHLNNSFESLAVSDCLITDYSTLCIDNLFFDNELIINCQYIM